ncbi:hypothetical protein FOA52_006315, partial [Chlamydomonas sp. UWO 241]
THIVPGVDGGLYAFHGIDENAAKLERLPISLPELVDASPSLAHDGSIIVGRRESAVFVLDTLTGRLVRHLSGGDGLKDRAGEVLKLQGGVDPERTIALAREDFVVRSMHYATGAETWNATFARILGLGKGSPGDDRAGGAGGGRAGAGSRLPRLTVAADNTLQAFDSATGFRTWSVAFDVPPIGAFVGGSPGLNHLDPKALSAAAALAAGDTTGAGLPLGPSTAIDGRHRHDKLAGTLAARGTRVLVGALSGSPYVMPADHLLLDEAALQQLMSGVRPARPNGCDDVGDADVGSGGIDYDDDGGACDDGGCCQDDNSMCDPADCNDDLDDDDRSALQAVKDLIMAGDDGRSSGVSSGLLMCAPGLHLLLPREEGSGGGRGRGGGGRAGGGGGRAGGGDGAGGWGPAGVGEGDVAWLPTRASIQQLALPGPDYPPPPPGLSRAAALAMGGLAVVFVVVGLLLAWRAHTAVRASRDAAREAVAAQEEASARADIAQAEFEAEKARAAEAHKAAQAEAAAASAAAATAMAEAQRAEAQAAAALAEARASAAAARAARPLSNGGAAHGGERGGAGGGDEGVSGRTARLLTDGSLSIGRLRVGPGAHAPAPATHIASLHHT